MIEITSPNIAESLYCAHGLRERRLCEDIDNFSYIPSNKSEYTAIGHDRRYDNLGIEGGGGLLFDTRSIGADWKFVSEEFSIATNTFNNPVDRICAGTLGFFLGLASTPKTLIQFGDPHSSWQVISSYNLSNLGVNNNPTIHKH